MFRSKSLITINEPLSLAAENYKMFRTNLNYMNLDNNNQVLLFTSSFMEEGKTTSIVNTAITFAQADKKVLLIECDLRKARIHQLFAIPQEPGLTNSLSENIALNKIVQTIEEVPGLDVLTAGFMPPNPSEILASKKMHALIEEAREKYDIILIDAPPVLSVADATILTKQADGVILVVAMRQSKKTELKEAKKKLQQVNANILGCLVTKAKIKGKKYYKYYK